MFFRTGHPPLNRRCGSPSVPFPEPFLPTFGTLDWVFSTPFGGSALTPDAPQVQRARYSNPPLNRVFHLFFNALHGSGNLGARARAT